MEEYDIMNLAWKSLVLKSKEVSLSFLPAKILLSRWQLSIKNESSPDLITASRQVAELYYKHKELPNAKKDIMLILHK